MPSKTSFFSKAFLLHDIKKYGWVAAAYTVALFFAVPLQILILQGHEQIQDIFIKGIFLLEGQAWQFLLTLAVPVVLAMLLFRYLQVKHAADTLHSLPVKRSVIFRSHILAGLILLAAPVLLNALMVGLLNPLINAGGYYGFQDVLLWIGLTILFNWFIFLTCSLMGQLVGSTTLQGILTYILLLFPAGITMLTVSNLQLLVYGFLFRMDVQNKHSPLTRMADGFNPESNLAMQGVEVLIYLILGLLFYLLAHYLYRQRDLEAAGQSIAFPQIHGVFIFGTAFCTMLVGGAYFHGMQQTMGWMVFGYIVGSLIGYIIALAIVQKSLGFFKDLKSLRGYAVFGTAMIILLIAINIDLTGYEKRQPQPQQIQKIFFDNRYSGNDQAYYSQPDNLQHIYALHQSIMANKTPDWRSKTADRYVPNMEFVFVYQLKNGRTLSRAYTVNQADYVNYLKPIYESDEYKNTHYDILQVRPGDVDKITFKPGMASGDYKEATILDPGEIKEAVEIMQQSIRQASYEQISTDKPPWGGIYLQIAEDKRTNYPKLLKYMPPDVRWQSSSGGKEAMEITHYWHKFDLALEQWLQEKGYLDQARLMPEEISTVLVEKISSREQWEEKKRQGFWKDWGQQHDATIPYLEITDKDQIEICLREYRDQWTLDYSLNQKSGDATGYILYFYGQQQEQLDTGFWSGSQTPDFIRDYWAAP